MATAIGRPSDYTPELAEEICQRLANGESTRQICCDDHMPDWRTLFRWLSDQSPARESFRQQYAAARESWLESLAAETLSIADDGQNDWMDRETARGRLIRTADRELVQRSQIRIEARKWLLSKLRPDKYGDRSLSGPQEVVVTVRPSWIDAPAAAVDAKPAKRLPPGGSV